MNKEKNERAFRKIIILTIISGGLALIGLSFWIIIIFVRGLYTNFILDFIAALFIIASGLTICYFFLYACSVVVFKNPQNLEKSARVKMGIGGVVSMIITLFLIGFAANKIITSTKDIKDYNKGNWEISEAVVEKVYWGQSAKNGLIYTSIGELTLPRKGYRLNIGETYRFFYLKHTSTIIGVEIVN